MVKYAILALGLSATSCNSDGINTSCQSDCSAPIKTEPKILPEPVKDPPPASCSVEQLNTGAKFTCTDGSIAYVKNGEMGRSGVNGSNGVVGPVGTNGSNGDDGNRGQDGYDQVVLLIAAGASCATGGTTFLMARDLNRNGTLDVLDDDRFQSATICNGVDGAAGADAQLPPFALVQIIDPCDDAPNVYDEVIIRLSNGQLLASFSDNVNGYNTRFSILPPGNYITTDGSYCHISIAFDLTITSSY